jgi:ATP-dependent DNA ligase
MILQTLYHKGHSGAIYQKIHSTEGADVISVHGQVGGQMQTARKTAEAKNVGRSNETTPEKQAELECLSNWQHDVDIKYRLSIEDVHNAVVDVMLAPSKGWAETKKYATWPADTQLKYDGCRCLAYWKDGRVVLQTRGRKEWNLPHIVAQLEKCLPFDAMWDGELYFHGVKRQVIQKWISKHYPETTKIQLVVYDVPMADGIDGKLWEERRKDLERLVPGGQHKPAADTPNIMKAITMEVENEEQLLAFQVTAIEQGYEGCMYRSRKGPYEPRVRSKYLLKVKTFEDAEFKCVGYTDGDGKNVGIVTWICSLHADAPVIGYVPNFKSDSDIGTFKADPLGDYDLRAEMFRDGDKYVGQKLTVKFQGVTNKNIPCFAKAVAFRLPEDESAF